jgi:hypothetical protein
MASAQFQLDTTDLLKILKGAGIAAAGAVLAYLAQNWASVDWGAYAWFAVPVGAILINAALKLLQGQPPQVQQSNNTA